MNGQVPYVESQVNMSRYMYPAANTFCHSPPLLPQPGALPYNQVLLACCNVSRSMRRRLPFQTRGTRTRRMHPTRMGAVWGDSSRKERDRVFNRCSFRCLRRGTKVELDAVLHFRSVGHAARLVLSGFLKASLHVLFASSTDGHVPDEERGHSCAVLHRGIGNAATPAKRNGRHHPLSVQHFAGQSAERGSGWR